MAGNLVSAVPIIPARNVDEAGAWYRDHLGFAILHTELEYGIVQRDGVQVHFWGPSGIEPKDSMTMYRVEAQDIDALYEDCVARGMVHPNAPLEGKPWGTREFAVTDGDGNLLTLFERT